MPIILTLHHLLSVLKLVEVHLHASFDITTWPASGLSFGSPFNSALSLCTMQPLASAHTSMFSCVIALHSPLGVSSYCPSSLFACPFHLFLASGFGDRVRPNICLAQECVSDFGVSLAIHMCDGHATMCAVVRRCLSCCLLLFLLLLPRSLPVLFSAPSGSFNAFRLGRQE